MKKILVSLIVALMLNWTVIPVNAKLVNNGNGLIYDTDQNITWYNTPLIARTWDSAVSWASKLAVTDVNGNKITGWRLPTTPGTSQGYVTEGELGYLYYNSLGNTPKNLVNVGDFTYLAPAIKSASIFQIWVGLTDKTNVNVAWDFHFRDGFQHGDPKGCRFYALAVHDGNVGAPVRSIPVNSAPVISTSGGGVYQINTTVMLGGTVYDVDGDGLTYQWLHESTAIVSRNIPVNTAIKPYNLSLVSVDHLPLGSHTLTLKVSDGSHEVSSNVQVVVVDTTAPTLVPVLSTTMLWPPNNKMVPVSIFTNASDNSGGKITVVASVTNNQDTSVKNKMKDLDWTEPIISDGVVTLELRAVKLAVYTITLTATDESGNSSMSKLTVMVPHDQGNKS